MSADGLRLSDRNLQQRQELPKNDLDHGEGFGPGADKADNNSGSRSRLNDRPRSADSMMARAPKDAHRKAGYTTATVPLPKIKTT